MAKTLLTLSFHLPEKLDAAKSNLREDALFKKHGVGSGLLTGESMGDDIPAELAEQPEKNGVKTPASGLSSGRYPDDETGTTQITLLRIGANAWWRKPFQRQGSTPSAFETWLKPHVEGACHCLLLAGHHSTYYEPDGVRLPVLWGSEDLRVKYRFFTAFVPTVKRDEGGIKRAYLTLMGHPYEKGRPAEVRGGPYDCTSLLKDCRLIVIIGCNGAKHGKLWQDWAKTASGARPVILGWHGVHGMPKDYLSAKDRKEGKYSKETFSKKLWNGLRDLSASLGLDLKRLCEEKSDKVIGEWEAAVKAAFEGGKQSSLWYARSDRCAGAMDAEGNSWRVRPNPGNAGKLELLMDPGEEE